MFKAPSANEPVITQAQSDKTEKTHAVDSLTQDLSISMEQLSVSGSDAPFQIATNNAFTPFPVRRERTSLVDTLNEILTPSSRSNTLVHSPVVRAPNTLVICLYVTQANGTEKNKTLLMSQIADIKRMYDNFRKYDKNLSLVISGLYIPNWTEIPSFSDQKFQELNKDFISVLKKTAGDVLQDASKSVEVIDFINTLDETSLMRSFLENNQALGNAFDLMKNWFAINKHQGNTLVIDSNTVIHDFATLYSATFGASEQRVALNVVNYDSSLASATNKVIYIPAGECDFRTQLQEQTEEFLQKYHSNLNEKEPKRNSVYNKTFNPACEKVGYVSRHFLLADQHTFFTAKIDHIVFRIARCISPAIISSWKPVDTNQQKVTPSIKSFQHNDVTYPYQSACYVLDKYAAYYKAMPEFINLNASENSFELHIKQTDFNHDMNILHAFLGIIFSQSNDKQDQEFKNDVIRKLQDTEKGQYLLEKFFTHSNTDKPARVRPLSELQKNYVVMRDNLIALDKKAVVQRRTIVFNSVPSTTALYVKDHVIEKVRSTQRAAITEEFEQYQGSLIEFCAALQSGTVEDVASKLEPMKAANDKIYGGVLKLTVQDLLDQSIPGINDPNNINYIRESARKLTYLQEARSAKTESGNGSCSSTPQKSPSKGTPSKDKSKASPVKLYN